MTAAATIGLDWGISDFRAYTLGADGEVLERRTAGKGILAVDDGDFEGVLRAEIGDWLTEDRPVLAAGMITSRQGWVETPYLTAPVGTAELAQGLVRRRIPSGLELRFVPGVTRQAADGVPDVMRGEETQIVGAAAGATRLMVLPGSHSKWALVEDGRIVWFATFMTGELYGALLHHTILGRPVAAAVHFDAGTFAAGVAQARATQAESGGLLHRLFSARTLYLFERLVPTGIADYISGLMIGAEIVEAQQCLQGRIPTGPVLVVGSAAITEHYLEALELAGLSAEAAPADVAARGLFAIARAAGLVEGAPG